MIPDPTMPTRLMTVPAMGGCYRSVGFAGSRCREDRLWPRDR